MAADFRSPSSLPPRGAGSAAAATGEAVAGRSNFIDPATLMRIKNLQLRARIVVEGFFGGLHRSPFHGFSVEFSEYRQYSPGDDLRYLDWKLLARSDRYYVKRFEDETNLRCHLLVDLSRSMSFSTVAYDKAEYAKTAAASWAYFLMLQRDAVGLLTFDEAIGDYLPARYRAGHLHRLMLSLERAPAGRGTGLAAALEHAAQVVAKRGLCVIVSDFLAPIASVERPLGALRARGHEVIVLRVLDRGELQFEFRDPALFEDLESGRQLYVDPVATRESYLRRFQQHAQELRRCCVDLGIDLFELPTDQPLELALFDLLQSRQRRGRRSRRSGDLRVRGETA